MANYFHYAHLKGKPDLIIGKRYPKGSSFGQVGKSGTKSPHLHFERHIRHPREIGFVGYTKGLTRAKILERWADPWKFISQPGELPMKYNKLGFNFMDWNSKAKLFHPGVDLNFGSGTDDLGFTVKTVSDEIPLYVGFDNGWGWHAFTEERTTMKQKTKVFSVGLNQDMIHDDYGKASDFVRKITDGEFEMLFDILYLPFQHLPLSPPYKVGDREPYHGVAYNFQAGMSKPFPNFKITQLAYEATEQFPNKNVLSLAYRGLQPFSQKYNQINGGFHLNVQAVALTIVHEMLHSYAHYLGLPDNLHAIEAEEKQKDPVNSRERALKRVMLSLKPHWPLLADKGANMPEPDKRIKTISAAGKYGILVIDGEAIGGTFARTAEEYREMGERKGVKTVKPDGSFYPADIVVD